MRPYTVVIRIHDDAGNVIETHENVGDFKEWWKAKDKTQSVFLRAHCVNRFCSLHGSPRSLAVSVFGFVYVRRACLLLRSHATFFGITRPPFTSARVLPSFGSSTPTSAGSAARNPQKFATPLYLNALSRTVFAVSGRQAFPDNRTGVRDSEPDDSG
jgi:hypothetical protein